MAPPLCIAGPGCACRLCKRNALNWGSHCARATAKSRLTSMSLHPCSGQLRRRLTKTSLRMQVRGDACAGLSFTRHDSFYLLSGPRRGCSSARSCGIAPGKAIPRCRWLGQGSSHFLLVFVAVLLGTSSPPSSAQQLEHRSLWRSWCEVNSSRSMRCFLCFVSPVCVRQTLTSSTQVYLRKHV